MPVYLVLAVASVLACANILVARALQRGPFRYPGPEGKALFYTSMSLNTLFPVAFVVGAVAALQSGDTSCAPPPGGRIKPIQPPMCSTDLNASTEWFVSGPAFGVCAVSGGALIVVAVLIRRRWNHVQPGTTQHHRSADIAALREQPHSSGGKP